MDTGLYCYDGLSSCEQVIHTHLNHYHQQSLH